MDERELEQIRRRYDEYSAANLSAYRAFMFEAHRDVGKLLGEVDRLRGLDGGQVGKGTADRKGRVRKD